MCFVSSSSTGRRSDAGGSRALEPPVFSCLVDERRILLLPNSPATADRRSTPRDVEFARFLADVRQAVLTAHAGSLIHTGGAPVRRRFGPPHLFSRRFLADRETVAGDPRLLLSPESRGNKRFPVAKSLGSGMKRSPCRNNVPTAVLTKARRPTCRHSPLGKASLETEKARQTTDSPVRWCSASIGSPSRATARRLHSRGGGEPPRRPGARRRRRRVSVGRRAGAHLHARLLPAGR